MDKILMKKIALAAIIASSLLTGCGESALPPECTEFIDSMDGKSGGPWHSLRGNADDIEKMESEWESMPDEKKKEVTEFCAQLKPVVKDMENEIALDSIR